jgi:hypothetical protein
MLSPEVCGAQEVKNMSHKEVPVPTKEEHKLSQTLTENTTLGEQIWGEIWPIFHFINLQK